MGRSTLDLVIGIVLIVIGALLCLGKLGVGGLLPFAGIVLLVLGIVMLMGVVAGSKVLAIVCIVVGVFLMTGFLSLPKAIGEIMWIVNIVLGIILIVLASSAFAPRTRAWFRNSPPRRHREERH